MGSRQWKEQMNTWITFKNREDIIFMEWKQKEHFIMIKGSIHQEYITTDIYTPKNTAPKYMKQNW